MAKQHDKQFKLDAVQYYQDHKSKYCLTFWGHFTTVVSRFFHFKKQQCCHFCSEKFVAATYLHFVLFGLNGFSYVSNRKHAGVNELVMQILKNFLIFPLILNIIISNQDLLNLNLYYLEVCRCLSGERQN